MQLAQGEVVSLLGPSGSGKTTLLRAVAGLEAPHRGTIRIEDRAVFDPAREARGAGREAQPRPRLPVVCAVAAPHRVRQRRLWPEAAQGHAAPRRSQRVDSALGNLGLGHLGDRLPHQLSGGQQQRVAIARALVYNPPVILMDEPLSNLDAKLREEARAWLRELILKMRLSALVVTHDQNEAMAMSDRILLLNNGVIEQQGTPQELYGHPNTLFIADFMGSNNRHRGQGRRAARRHGQDRRRRLAALGRGARRQRRRGTEATGMIRLERVRLASGRGENTRAAAARRRRCSWATDGSTCSTAATCACAPTGRPRCRPATSGWRFRRRASGSSDRRRGRGTSLAAPGSELGGALQLMDKFRLDKWLWAARLFKTRALAAEDIGKGRVVVNGQAAKASRELHEGDMVELRQAGSARDARGPRVEPPCAGRRPSPRPLRGDAGEHRAPLASRPPGARSSPSRR